MPACEKILVAMSGGVDSSVAALLLKRQGHEVAGAYMKNWLNEDGVIGECPWEQDIADARAVAEKIGIEFTVVNFMQAYRERVVAYLLDGYSRGLTPNPDVMCNREIKFGLFREWAKGQGFDAVATGHYARRHAPAAGSMGHGAGRSELGYSEKPLAPRPMPRAPCTEPRAPRPEPHSPCPEPHAPRPLLFEGADKNKDQSYFLALLSPQQLADARFPIGDLAKPELRRIAREAGLPTAGKKDSQGICFIGEVKMTDFLRTYVPDEPGPVVRASDGRTLGEHRGLHYYTIGQRRGIRVPSNMDNENYVVVGKRAADRALLVAFDHPDAPGLYQDEVRVHSISWIGESPLQPSKLEGRVRYRDPRVALEFIPEGGGTARIRFEQPQRALASGQVLAFYEGERLLGGGVYL